MMTMIQEQETGGQGRIFAFADLDAQQNALASRSEWDEAWWDHVAGFTLAEGRRITGDFTPAVVEAEIDRSYSITSDERAINALLEAFEAVCLATAAAHGEELGWPTLAQAFGTTDDGSVLVPLPSGDAVRLRPDDMPRVAEAFDTAGEQGGDA